MLRVRDPASWGLHSREGLGWPQTCKQDQMIPQETNLKVALGVGPGPWARLGTVMW